MSAAGQKRKWPGLSRMSGLPSRADIVRPSLAANFDEFAVRINCGNAAFRGQFDNRRATGDVLEFFRYHERIRSILFHRLEDALVLCLVEGAAQQSSHVAAVPSAVMKSRRRI